MLFYSVKQKEIILDFSCDVYHFLIITDLGEAPISGLLYANSCFYMASCGHSRKTAVSEETDVPDFRFSEPRDGQIFRFAI
ncbi:Uncharacterized protein dnm_012880 [Desulfonema magnum]|uniref:Uncharacterized protein n=1 Tax=Desulfonema magnum TaxID=45655 RepID=A0A975BHA9_9BACT|nr:Uncharacterized protein dnm_012880 [Desulfonema magnum]